MIDTVAFFQAFIALFVILDPIANIPVFLTLTEKMDKKDRRSTVNQAIIVAFALLFAFALLGDYIIKFLGIKLESFMIAGGLLLLVISFDMLKGELPKTRHVIKEEVSIVPMATPLLAGPGAITTTIYFINTMGTLITVLAVVSAIIASAILLHLGEGLHNLLGPNASRGLTRIMGLILAAFAVDLMRKGIFGLWSGGI
ncbi:MAG: MarC family protein [Euryarchaeota archaeon]|nr:MarC family protein [Euryarchaeota archaeon]